MRLGNIGSCCAVACGMLATLLSSAWAGQESESPSRVEWLSEYAPAYKLARSSGRMLLVHFYEASEDQQRFERLALNDEELLEKLGNYVVASVPLTAAVAVEPEQAADGGAAEPRQIRLIDHSSFRHLRGQRGLAIIDLKHPQAAYYGDVVSVLPFWNPAYRTRDSIATLLDLPAGTITQRTMVYAVRMHPENPVSTRGHAHPALLREAGKHSHYQASITVQGHHQWDSRFHQIAAEVGGSPTEVCAESWPGKDLVEACIDCVDSWRHSSGHWNAVRSWHRHFGYDIKQGRNGIWYATGIFSN